MKPQPITSAQRAHDAPARKRPRQNGGWRKFIPYSIGAALLIAIGAGLRPRPLEVETASIVTGTLAVSVLEEGKTRIRHRYTISPPMAGYLNRVPLRAGDRIEAGKTVLATIQAQPAAFLDPRARGEAEARVKGAEAAQMQRETQIERARSALELANKELARARELKKSGAIATKEWDTAESQVDVLTRELHTAEFGLQVAIFELAQARAVLVQTETPVGESSAPVTILAPVNGFVLQVFEESARIVPAGTAIMEVGDPTDLEAEIELLSSDAVGVQPSAEVSIEQWGGEQPLRGKVTIVEPGGYTKISALGVEEQRVKVRVDFVEPFPSGRALGDRFRVEARIFTWHGERVLQVPTGALFRRGGDWMTFTLDAGKARLTKVEIAHNNGVAAEVHTGLSEGQRVILHPPDAVADGARVQPRSP
jgi:HlyD family secretion protein